MKTYDFHPLADMFPLMEGEDFDALVADIKAHGLKDNIILYEGKILDGRNRYRACKAAGVEVHYWHFYDLKGRLDRPDPAAYVISANLHRRHLTAEQKREVIAKLLKAQPEKSDRQIGKMAMASKNTAKSVRDELEARGQIDHVETRTDTKGRKQPAKKKTDAAKRAANPAASAEVVKAPAEQPDQTIDLAPKGGFSNPIIRAWCNATNAQRREFVLDFKVNIEGIVAEEQRRLDIVTRSLEDRRLGRPLVEPEGNGADHPQASADQRKAEFAKLDDGIPDILRRRAPEAP
jgi:ParB-like nuclease domain